MDYFFDPNRLPSFLVPFVSLSYSVDRPLNVDSFPNSSYYDIGYLDICLIVTIIAIMAVLRDAARILLLEPFANWKLTRDWRRRQALKSGSSTPDSKAGNAVSTKTNGRTNGRVTTIGSAEKLMADRPVEHSPEARRIRHAVIRFAEQGWQAIYYLYQWSLGMYIHYYLPSNLWAGYPHIPLPGIVKAYYLMQISLFVHAVLLLNAEAPRKDHWQMMTHHVVTVILIVASYAYNFTRVGCLIMVIMDWCDIFLPLAKMLRYLSYQTACDVTFVWWMFSWVITRHVLFCKAIASTTWDGPKQIEFGWWPERGHWFTKEVHQVFVSLLVFLEVIQSVWSYLIFGVAYRVLKGEGADDSRSDDEGEDEEVKKDR
ncbi:longevity assurance proteins LAG1/LAC1 [Russula ochroleuca]|jgi:acyl-CoA-dependent ceramide synthase|uniref:Longevity assurance proteins LAG1/LAC1 n=1 Tax=Russula ochroleuca TaxID=152965 RepID=A0A9P5N1R1_9AGAM|nr:longevity assurance proteins LAG1/LAC1 [Russula ochroleuca]